jgi:hypothetical protein
MHINLPFADDREFARLHAAIRLLLPVLPALAASSPIVESQITGLLDNRLDTYRKNAAQIPSVSGKVIPEPVFTRHDYEQVILERIYRDLAAHDPGGVLRYEWVNARGAIARFDRNAIEIRVLDTQECPLADLAVGAAVVETVRAHVDQAWCDLAHQQAWDVDPLYDIFLQTMAQADRAIIRDRRYLDAFGFPERGDCLAGELWQHLIEALSANNKESGAVWGQAWAVLIQHGPLARRILKALGKDSDANAIRQVYGDLCECLSAGKMFIA